MGKCKNGTSERVTATAGAEAPEEAMEEPSIRVVLMTNDYESYYHSEVSLEFQGNYQTEGVIQKTFLPEKK